VENALLVEIIIFLASISPSGLQFENLSGISIPESNATIVQVADSWQNQLKEDSGVFATSKVLAAHIDGEKLTKEKLKSLPKTAVTCCELIVAAYSAFKGNKKELANLLAVEAKDRVIKLPMAKDSDALIVRELSHLLLHYFQLTKEEKAQQEMMHLYARITLSRFITSPHLVGASVVQLADQKNSTQPDDKKSADFYQKVILDLNYLAKKPENYPHAETYESLFWLKQAYEACHKIKGDDQAKVQAEKVDALLKKEKVDEAIYVKPRYGLLAKLYCDEPHFIALAIANAELADRKISDQGTISWQQSKSWAI